MKTFLSLLIILTGAVVIAAPTRHQLKVTAANTVIADSAGHFTQDSRQDFIDGSRVLTINGMHRFYPALTVEAGRVYVEVMIDDCVYDIALVAIDPNGAKAPSVSYVDLSDPDSQSAQ